MIDIRFNRELPNKITKPYISVIVPTFQRAELLRETLTTLVNQKTEVIYEIVVVDNDSEAISRSEEIVESFNSDIISYYRNGDNVGMFGNWNRGLELARGKWSTVVCDDDLVSDRFIEAAALNTTRGYNFIALGSVRFSDSGKLRNRSFFSKRAVVTKYDMIFKCACPPVGSFYKTEYAKEIGGFNSEIYPSADYDFYVRYINSFGSLFIDYSATYCYYRTVDNTSSKIETVYGFIEQDDIIRRSIVDSLTQKCSRAFWSSVSNHTKRRYIQHNLGKFSIEEREKLPRTSLGDIIYRVFRIKWKLYRYIVSNLFRG